MDLYGIELNNNKVFDVRPGRHLLPLLGKQLAFEDLLYGESVN